MILPGASPGLETDVQQDRDFRQRESSQSNSLSGSIAVTGHRSDGERAAARARREVLQLNRGQEYIPERPGAPGDLAPDNSVLSTRRADARIGYSGTGELAQSNNMGWLGQFFIPGCGPYERRKADGAAARPRSRECLRRRRALVLPVHGRRRSCERIKDIAALAGRGAATT